MFKSIQSRSLVIYIGFIFISFGIILGVIAAQQRTALFDVAIDNSMTVTRLHAQNIGLAIQEAIESNDTVGPESAHEILHRFENIKLQGDSYGWVADHSGLLVMHPDHSLVLNLNILDAEEFGYPGFDQVAEAMMSRREGYGTYSDTFINENKVVTYAEIPGTDGWKLGITTLQKDIYGPTGLVIQDAMVTSVLLLLLFILVVFRLNRSIMKPLRELEDAVKVSVDDGFKPLRVDTKYEEVTGLADAYNEMTAKVQVHTNELEELVRERTGALDEMNMLLSEQNKKLTQAYENLNEVASLDALTGLYNRASLFKYFRNIQVNFELGTIENGHIFFMDLDNFKYYNDNFGHDIGDRILEKVAELFKSAQTRDDFIARYGGDEFVAVFVDRTYEDVIGIKEFLENWMEIRRGIPDVPELKEKVGYMGIPTENQLGLSIGFIEFNTDNIDDVDALLRDADALMYQVKEEKKSGEKDFV